MQQKTRTNRKARPPLSANSRKTKPGYRALTPKSETGRRFTHWFNHGWESIEKTPTSWTTVTEYPLSRREIWNRHQDPSKIIGLRFGTTTRFLALDIDLPSPYHPANDATALGKIKAALEKVGLCRHVLIQSSHNGGVHLYTPLPAAVPTFKAACVLKAALERAGLKIEKGKLEIFPNPKRYAKPGEEPSRYNGLRLPLQPGSGSYLLDDDFNPVSDRVEDFLNQMDWAAAGQNLKTFKARLNPAYKKYQASSRQREDKDSKNATEWKCNVEARLAEGWTDYGQTNTLLIEFVAYTIVFLGLKGRELRERVKERVINAPGYQTYCRHQHEIDRRIEQVCYYTERNRYYLPYRNHPERDSTFEEIYNRGERPARKTTSQGEDARERMIETVAYLEKRDGQLPERVSERRNLIQVTSKELHGKGFSIATLSHRDYLPYWHPKYRDETGRATRPDEESPEPPISPLETPESLPDEELDRSEVPPAAEALPLVLPDPPTHPLEKPEPIPDEELYRAEADPDQSANSPDPSLSSAFPIETPELLSDQQLYRSEDREILELEPPQTLTGQKFVLHSSLYEVLYGNLTDRPEAECSVSDISPLSVPVLPDCPDPIENSLSNPEIPLPRKRKQRWAKLTLVQRLEKWKARKIPLVYTGSIASGLVETKEVKRSRLHSIDQWETVQISDLNHTSFLFNSDEEENLRIYVKPIDRGKEWKTGIAVLAKCLQPIDDS
jgi:hypothetical protein